MRLINTISIFYLLKGTRQIVYFWLILLKLYIVSLADVICCDCEAIVKNSKFKIKNWENS